DLFFRSGGEYYLCTALWDSGRRVKQLSGVRMHHDRAMTGRSGWDWKFHGLRSQVLVMFMRDPWYLLAPRCVSKALRSLVKFAGAGQFQAWWMAWSSALSHLPEALRLRRPMGWRTQQLLWRLRRETVTDCAGWPGSGVGDRRRAGDVHP
ncbi:MAG: hypothetical protein JXB04_05045, partial [Kiritimatiellae bacterium]|nr:hypothetical protein [Kiritimatiellia bacterium]